MKKQTLRIRECAGMECGGVDEARPIISRVKLLGFESRNNRRYLPESITASEYERKPVNLNHSEGANKQRRIEERFGWIENPVMESGAWWGDLHYNPKHPFAEQFAWAAKNNPALIGMSQDAVGTGHYDGGVFVVEKALVRSVDLVADPASTHGLFESMESELTPAPDAGTEEKSLEQQIGELVVAIIKDDAPTSEKRSKVLKALKLLDEPEDEEEEETEESEESEEEPEEEDEEGEKKTEESLKALAKLPGGKALLERLDVAETKLALRERNELAQRLCQEARLPAVALTKVFLASLIEARDEKAMKELIEDRKGVVNVQTPRGSGLATGKTIDNKSFAQQIRS